MTPYPKIQSVFKRDPATKHKTFLVGEFSTPELAALALCEWVAYEKVDGTNIRVHWDPDRGFEFGGRSDNAQIPAHLVNALNELFEEPGTFEDVPHPVTMYGEGYGAKIQKGGGNYRQDQGFVLFDVKVGDWWLTQEAVTEFATHHQVDRVPEVDRGTIHYLVNQVRSGLLQSRWGPFLAEGYVMRPVVDLFDRRGHRIITKVKAKDFGHTELRDKIE